VSLQYLAWAVLSLWQIGPAGWSTYAPAVVVLAAATRAGPVGRSPLAGRLG
jgi:hypothetical protein